MAMTMMGDIQLHANELLGEFVPALPRVYLRKRDLLRLGVDSLDDNAVVKRSEFHWRSLSFQAVNWISLCKQFFAALSATCFSSCVSLCFLGLILRNQHSELMFDGDRCRKFDFSSEPVIAHWTLL